MEALGMIETYGLIAAIESADAMLKAAEVTLLDCKLVKGGIVTVTVTGEVGAAKASVDAGAGAVQRLGTQFLRSAHVIPRPDKTLGDTVTPFVPLIEKQAEKDNDPDPDPEPVPPAGGSSSNSNISPDPELAEQREEAAKAVTATEPAESAKETEAAESKPETVAESAVAEVKVTGKAAAEVHKETVDEWVESKGVDATIELISKCRVDKLRNLAREYSDFGITGRVISKTNKTGLIDEFRKYYSK